mmetsp:Transcript_33875/g.24918  ORF Transcript_33875/g.24918 Transcript_33875/m.24918 type:complete len:82 (-) Transcript_33875:24-269(-)
MNVPDLEQVLALVLIADLPIHFDQNGAVVHLLVVVASGDYLVELGQISVVGAFLQELFRSHAAFSQESVGVGDMLFEKRCD